MTLTNKKAADEYFLALSDGHSDNETAQAVDRSIDALLESLRSDGIAFPADDRLANIEVEIYRVIKEQSQ